MDEKELNSYFLALVYSIKQACLVHLGKIINPATNKVEKNLEQAKVQIEILEMIKEKTKGNLTKQEQTLLDDTLTELRLNYLEELKKEEKKQ